MSHRIIPRTEWGARHGHSRHTRPLGALGVVLHHTAGADAGESGTFTQDAAIVRGVETHHQNQWRQGIGYHFLITAAGRIFEGAPIDRIGAHVAGHNSPTAGVAFVGNRDNSVVSRPALEAAAWLLRHGVPSVAYGCECCRGRRPGVGSGAARRRMWPPGRFVAVGAGR